MKSKNWPGKFVLACAATSLLAGRGYGQTAPAASKTPAIALLDAADAPQWKTWTRELGWRVVTASSPSPAIDLRVNALASAVRDAIRDSAVDPERIYLAGRGDAAAAVFYTISRVPDLWAAGVAIGGSPEPAIATDRIFTADFTNVPVLWISGRPGDEAVAAKLKSEKLNLELRSATGATNASVLEWLGSHRRDAFPTEIDCETNSPTFASCYWIQMTKFDANERNDVLPSTRLQGGSGAALDLGGFGFPKEDAGPGVPVTYLPEKYSGPLKMGDRIVALDGRPIENVAQYTEMMAKTLEEKNVVATVQRGKERIRLETRIVLPRRDRIVTARVYGQYLPAEKDIQIISRTVTEMRVTIPPEWAQGGRLYWNGVSLEKVDTPGCFLLTIDRELLHATPCAN